MATERTRSRQAETAKSVAKRSYTAPMLVKGPALTEVTAAKVVSNVEQ
ncbi:MAG: hypothetical protein IT536_06440 [Hyphomicrobiales bacterium]|nr:hypothetical protein [Hyphomicrobiales bacterium]